METTSVVDQKIGFKSKKQRNIRKRADLSDTEDKNNASNDDEFNSKLEETRTKQKLRTRQSGVSVVGLALGKKMTIEEELTSKDAFNIKSGGMVNMQALKSGKIKSNDVDAYDTGIGTQFSAETNKRDEDEEMMKYIEEKLKKQRGESGDEKEDGVDGKYLLPEEAALLSLPDHLRHGSAQRSEEMLSNQMLSGIPEIDLGIEAKIKNIEATEEAKQKLILQQKNKSEGPSHFVPANMAVNFVQHNRFNIDDSETRKRKLAESAGGRKPPVGPKDKTKKATDDYHYDKFKKQFRRH